MGRQLSSFDNTTYSYNESGIRTSKTVGEDTTEFYLDGTNVIYQTDGTNDIYFFYDRNNELVGFKYSGNNYFYVKNAMGDITDITDSSGAVVASYTYDPWGKVLSVTGNTVIGELNPFRYRSYYYDDDIGMYYLQSRYYNPEVGRFINCDDVNYIGLTESEISYNPFAYCENCPVDSSDITGNRVVKGSAQTYAIYVYYYENVGKYGHVDISVDDINIYSYGSYAYINKNKELIETSSGAFKKYKYNKYYGGYFGKYKKCIKITTTKDEAEAVEVAILLLIATLTSGKPYKIAGKDVPYRAFSDYKNEARRRKAIKPLYEYKVVRGKYAKYSITSANCATFVRNILLDAFPYRARRVDYYLKIGITPKSVIRLALQLGGKEQ